MKKWLRNMTVALCLGGMLGLSACSLDYPDFGTNGTDTPIASSFGKVALVEYTDNTTTFLDYDGEHSYTYDKIVNRQLTAMAEDIASRLWTIYGDQNGNLAGSDNKITIMDKLNSGKEFLNITLDGVVANNATKYIGDKASGKVSIKVGTDSEIHWTQGGNFEDDLTNNVYYDTQVDSTTGEVTIKDLGNGNTTYPKYNHYYIDETDVNLSYHYGIVFQGNYASLFNNFSNILYHMNGEHLDADNKVTGTIENSPMPKGQNEDNNYNLTNILNFKHTINGGPRWAVVAKWNDDEITDDNVVEGGVYAGQDPRSDDYYQFFFYFNESYNLNIEDKIENNILKKGFRTEVKEKYKSDSGVDFDQNHDQLIIIEQPAWEITKHTSITKEEDLTNILKKYLASIIVSGGDSALYLKDDVTTDTNDAIYNNRVQNITYTANWLELYYDDILEVIKKNIIGDELWGEDDPTTKLNNDSRKGAYLQGLSDDLYKFTTENISNILNNKLNPNDYFIAKTNVPKFQYGIINSKYLTLFLKGVDHSWFNFNQFLINYLTSRNYQAYDLLVPTLLRSCANHTYSTTIEGEEKETGTRWYVSSKSGMTIYKSPDDFAGNNAEIKPARNYKSVIFFAKEATDLSKYSVMVFFGNVERAFAVRPIVTLVNGNGQTKEITTLGDDDYSISAQDKEYLNGDKETGKYVVKADSDYTGYEEASFFIEFSKGSIVGPGSFTTTQNPTIVDNDWVLQVDRQDKKVNSVDTILNGYNYIQISFEQYDLSGNLLGEKVPYGVLIDIVD